MRHSIKRLLSSLPPCRQDCREGLLLRYGSRLFCIDTLNVFSTRIFPVLWQQLARHTCAPGKHEVGRLSKSKFVAYIDTTEEALPSILRAISIRGPLPPFLRLLCEILASLKQDTLSKSAEGGGAATALGELIEYVKVWVQPRASPLRNDAGVPSNAANTTITHAIPEMTVREKASTSGLSDFEEQVLVTLLCRGASTTVEDIRSVRGL